MTDIDTLDLSIARIQPEVPVDDVLTALMWLDAYMERGRELKELLHARAIEWIEQNGPIESGTVRWWVGFNKTTKCMDVRAAVEALLDKSGGDMDAFVGCLSANAIKHGAARQVLVDEWDKHFQVTETPKLVNDVPKKELMKVDSKFLKG